MINIVYIGCVESSYVILDYMLKNDYKVSGVVTMNRSDTNSDFHSLAPLAGQYGIDCCCTKNVNDTETFEFVKSKNPDVIYCFGWSRLIGRELLSLPRKGIIGFHPAALPANRGRHPLIWALALGLKKTASTFFVMDEGADTGDIISQKEIIIDYSDDAQSLYDKVLQVAKLQVIEFTDKLNQNALQCIPQEPESGNTWRKRGRLDGQIDWRMSCDGIYNLVRALTYPYVGAHFMYNGKEIKVWKCEAIHSHEYENIESGKVLKVRSENDFTVKAYDGIIHITACDGVKLAEGEYL